MLWLLGHSKLKQQQNRLDNFSKSVVAEEIGLGNEIILSKIDQGNELRELRLD